MRPRFFIESSRVLVNNCRIPKPAGLLRNCPRVRPGAISAAKEGKAFQLAKRQEDVIFKGHKNGVLAVLNDEIEYPSLKEKLAAKLALAERFFFEGAEVTLDVGRRMLTTPQLVELDELLRGRHGLCLVDVLHTDPSVAGEPEEEPDLAAREGERGAATQRRSASRETDEQQALQLDSGLVRRTLRSGQRVQCDGNVVIMGDVNPGAVVIATGDILVMGVLRGVAHAGATGNQRAVVAAFRLEPTQLRVANFISRSPDETPAAGTDQPRGPEVASIKNGVVVIEPYLPHVN